MTESTNKAKPLALKMVIRAKKQSFCENPFVAQMLPQQTIHNSRKNQDKTDQIQALKQSIKSLTQTFEKIIPVFKQQAPPEYQLQHRDRKVRYLMPVIGQNQKLSKETLQLWIAGLCREVFSASFHKFQYNYLTFQQAKIYCSENIISNIICLTQTYQITSTDLKIIDRHLHTQISAYLEAKYPLTQLNVVNKTLESVVKNVNNLKSPQNDMFYIFSKNSFGFQYRESGNYNDLIMNFINFMMECIDQGAETSGFSSNQTIYDQFYKEMQEIFSKLYNKQWMFQNLRQSKQKTQIKNTNQLQDQKYKADVQKYTSWLIGRKISQNVPKYSRSEIENMNITIKHPSILRILTKWCQELLAKFEHNYFLGKIENFMSVKGRNTIIAYEWLKQAINEEIQIEKQQIKQYLQQLQKNNYDQQEVHLIRSLKANFFTNVQKIQRSAGIFSVNTVKNLHSYIILYLNRIIHGLLKVSKKTSQNILKKHNKWNILPNLISFAISDLMRCKIASKQREIYRIYQQLKRISDTEPSKLRIVRIKNRLNKNTNDILINIKFRQKYLCEIQLAINADQSNFIQCSNKFCHFVYELQRSIFGPLTELCSIWSSLDPRTKIYQKMAKKMIIQSHPKQSVCRSKQDHRMRQYRFPFICSECHYNYSQITCFEPHRWCDDCNAYWICGKCRLKEYSQEQLKERLFLKYDQQILKSSASKIEDEDDIPECGVCCYMQSKNMKLKKFKRVQTAQIRGLFTNENNKIEMIAELLIPQNQIKFKKKYIIFQINNPQFIKQVNISEEEIQKNFLLPKKIEKIYNQEKDRIALINKSVNDQNCEKILKGGLSDFQKIKFLQLSSNQLTNINFIVKNFKKLQKLIVCQNQIKSLDGMSILHSLQTLDFHKNLIQEIPQQIFTMSSLNQINIGQNLLTEIPQQIVNLINLQNLKAKGLQLYKLPQSFTHFFSLKHLNLSQNNFTTIPQEIKSLIQLQQLSLNQNLIDNVPEWIVELIQLKILQLNFNNLKTMPSNFEKIKLQELYLQNNTFQRLQNFCLPQSIIFLSLANNNISYIWQPFFKNCSQLQRFNISHNQITHLPPSARFCTSLFYLDVSYNQIKSTTQVLKVSDLSLAHNPLIKVNYLIFQHQNYLRKLDVSFTLLSTFPKELKYIQSLSSLNISGMICDFQSFSAIKNFKHLQKFYMTKMNLKQLPSSIKQLHYLSVLDVSQNQLTTFEDDFFKKLTYLNQLYVNNNLIQRLPSSFIFCKKLRKIDLSNNNLIDFPTEVFDFPMIKQINIEGNHNFNTGQFAANIKTQLPYEFKKVKELIENLSRRRQFQSQQKDTKVHFFLKKIYEQAKKRIKTKTSLRIQQLEQQSKIHSPRKINTIVENQKEENPVKQQLKEQYQK